MKHLEDFLKRNRELEKGVEAGPWYAHPCGQGKAPCWCKVVGTTPAPDGHNMDRIVSAGSASAASAEFIAASRTSLPLALGLLGEAIAGLKDSCLCDPGEVCAACDALAALEEKAGRG